MNVKNDDKTAARMIVRGSVQGIGYREATRHEARRLGRALDGAECTCNPIYDFVESSMSALQAAMTRVVMCA